MLTRNEILLELLKRLQADKTLIIDLSDLISEIESIEIVESVGDEE